MLTYTCLTRPSPSNLPGLESGDPLHKCTVTTTYTDPLEIWRPVVWVRNPSSHLDPVHLDRTPEGHHLRPRPTPSLGSEGHLTNPNSSWPIRRRDDNTVQTKIVVVDIRPLTHWSWSRSLPSKSDCWIEVPRTFTHRWHDNPRHHNEDHRKRNRDLHRKSPPSTPILLQESFVLVGVVEVMTPVVPVTYTQRETETTVTCRHHFRWLPLQLSRIPYTPTTPTTQRSVPR